MVKVSSGAVASEVKLEQILTPSEDTETKSTLELELKLELAMFHFRPNRLSNIFKIEKNEINFLKKINLKRDKLYVPTGQTKLYLINYI